VCVCLCVRARRCNLYYKETERQRDSHTTHTRFNTILPETHTLKNNRGTRTHTGGNAPTQGTEANIDSRVQGIIRESKTLIRGPLHNSTIPVELKEGDTYASLKDQGIYLQDVRNIPTQFVEIGPSTWDSVGSPMPDVLHEPYTVRETESLPKGDPNSIYYERARQNDLDDVDGWPALSVCCLLSVPFCAIGLVLCIPTFLSFCLSFLHLILFSSSDPVFPRAKTISFGRRPATCQSCIQTHVHDLMKDLKTSSASRVMKDLRTSSFVPSPKSQHTHSCMYSHLVTTRVHLNFDMPII
jgi:hypothetical protein